MEREENGAEYSKAFNVPSQAFVITGDRVSKVAWYTSTKSLLYQVFKYLNTCICTNKKMVLQYFIKQLYYSIDVTSGNLRNKPVDIDRIFIIG